MGNTNNINEKTISNPINIIIKYESAEIKIGINDNKSLEELQTKIYNIMNIYPFFQDLYGQLIDNTFLGYIKYPFQNGARIYLRDNHSMKFKTENDISFYLDIKQYDTISDIQYKIYEYESIPPSKQMLSYNEFEFKDESKSLYRYIKEDNLQFNNVLQFELIHPDDLIHKDKSLLEDEGYIKISFKKSQNINIKILIDKKTEDISINLLDSVDDLYKALEGKINKKIDIYEKILKYNDDFLFLKKSLLIQYDFIKDNVILEYIKPSFNIFIRDWKGKIFPFFCNENETIEKINQILYKFLGYEKYRLTYNGLTLINDKDNKLKDYNILYQSTIRVESSFSGYAPKIYM